MTRRLRARTPLPLSLNRKVEGQPPKSLYRELYFAMRDAVLSGRWPPGTRLPSTRQIAGDLGISRTTATAAFDLLLAEGYVEGIVGSGTFVARDLPVSTIGRHASGAPPGRGPALSIRGRDAGARQPFTLFPTAAFAPGRPDIDLFPFELWSRLQAQCWRRPDHALADCRDPRGYPPLRDAIAVYLREMRAVNCTGDQVIITSGAQQAYDLLARVLIDPGDEVWCEDPGYGPAAAALAGAGAKVVPVAMDAAGMAVTQGRTLSPAARLVLTTPSHHYPLGTVMSLARRFELLSWAAEANSWIIEDDYDSEFRYDGRPLASLQSLDCDGRVIYVGTFSKLLLPTLRLGYLVVPASVAEGVARARAANDQHPPIWNQPVLARFIAEGHLASHLRRVRSLYALRQQSLLDGRPHLQGLLELEPSHAGLQLVGGLAPELRARMDDVAAAERAHRAGIYTSALSTFYRSTPARQGLLLGYACVPEAEMDTRVRQLAAALR